MMEGVKMSDDRSTAAMAILLHAAMGMPMMMFYAIGILGPQIIADLGISQKDLGWFTASAFGLAAVLSPWVGGVVQRIGSQRGLMVLFLLVGLSFTLIASLSGFQGFVLAMLFCGFAQALANPATNQAIAQMVPVSRKAAIVGFKQAGVQVSALLAGILLPGMSTWLGWRGAILAWVPLLLFLAFITRWLVGPAENGNRPDSSTAFIAPNGRLLILMAIQFCAGSVLSSFITFIGVYADQLGMPGQQIGAMVSAFGIMGIVSRMVLTPLGSRMRDETVLLGALFFMPVIVLMVTRMAEPGRYWPLWVGVVGLGMTLVATNAIAMSMLLRDGRFGTPARASGMLSLGFFGGFSISPPLFGVIIGIQGGFSMAWMYLIMMLVIGFMLCIPLYRMRLPS